MTDADKAQKQRDYYIATKSERRKYERETYAWLKSMHRCVECKAQDAYTINGRARCADCAERAAQKYREWRASGGAEKEKISRDKRKLLRAETGCCTICGKALPSASSGGKMCQRCQFRQRKYDRAALLKRNPDVNLPRGDNGFCWICNKQPALSGKKLCGGCMDAVLARLPDMVIKAKECRKSNDALSKWV